MLPIITIFFIEYFSSPEKYNFKNTSFGRLNRSGGYFLPDIWYFVISTLSAQIPLIASCISLGYSTLNTNVSIWFSKLYKGFLPDTQNELLAIFIIVISILLNEFASYWIHRVSHENSFLWSFHEFHHSAKKMTIFSRDRATPFEGIFITTLFIPLTVLNGLLINQYLSEGYLIPILIYAMYLAFSLSATYAAHSSLEIIYPKPFSKIFMSPSLHWLHHSSNPKHYNCNYGQVITLWDKVFGSYMDESHLKEITEFGINNTAFNKYHPFYSYMILPLIRLKKGFQYLFTS